jgi:hypothetical protein
MRRILTRIALLFALVVVAMIAYVGWVYLTRPFVEGRDAPRAYSILRDQMDTIIVIGVDANVSDRQLCATMSRAAEEHMNDRARDLLASQFISIEAYLVKDGKQSDAPAGSLNRLVHPAGRRNLLPNFLTDRFRLSLDGAKRSLQ